MTTRNSSNSVVSARLDAQHLDGPIKALFAATSQEERFQAICRLACLSTGAAGVAVLLRRMGKVSVLCAFPPEEPAEQEAQVKEAPAPAWLMDLARCYGQMLAGNVQAVLLGPERGGAFGVFVPLGESGDSSLAVAANVCGGRQIRLQNVVDALQLTRANLFLADRGVHNGHTANGTAANGHVANGQEAGEGHLLDVVECISDVLSCPRFFAATVTLCARVAGTFGCRRVGLGHVRNGHVKVTALDQMENFSRGTRSVRLMEEAMQEALDQDCMVFWSDNEEESDDPRVITRAAREFAALSGAGRVLSIPLRVQDAVVFVLLLVMDGPASEPLRLDAVTLVCTLAAPRLHELALAEEMPLKKAWRYCLLRSADVFGPHRTALKLTVAAVGFLLTLSLLCRGEVEVVAPLTVEGVHTYTHTAPMDSYLREVLARPGDHVRRGQVLGKLDATEVGMEIAALDAQLSIHENQANQHLQEGKEAEATIARLEAERTAANLDWARQRRGMTELRSGVDGFLVSEDMTSRLGQPVRRGQELFEVTDTASLRIVAHVAEDDVSDVTRAMRAGEARGAFTLTAYPGQPVPFTVERVHPFATVVGTNNGFDIWGRLDDQPSTLELRPGMEGYARIATGSTPLLHLWTRKTVNKLRLFLWRWL